MDVLEAIIGGGVVAVFSGMAVVGYRHPVAFMRIWAASFWYIIPSTFILAFMGFLFITEHTRFLLGRVEADPESKLERYLYNIETIDTYANYGVWLFSGLFFLFLFVGAIVGIKVAILKSQTDESKPDE